MASIDTNLLSEVKALTKRANQRLRQLEKSGVSQQSRAYRYVKRLVFDKQINNIVDVTKKGEPKFKTSFSNLSNGGTRYYLECIFEYIDRNLIESIGCINEVTLTVLENAGYNCELINLNVKSKKR